MDYTWVKLNTKDKISVYKKKPGEKRGRNVIIDHKSFIKVRKDDIKAYCPLYEEDLSPLKDFCRVYLNGYHSEDSHVVNHSVEEIDRMLMAKEIGYKKGGC